MTDPSNGEWVEYRRMFEADRQSNSEKFRLLFNKMEEVRLDVRAMRTEREVAKVTGGYVIPALLGIAGAWVARKLGVA